MMTVFSGRYLMGRFPSSLPGVFAHFVTGEIHRVGVVDYSVAVVVRITRYISTVELRGPFFYEGVRVWPLSSFRGFILSSNFVSIVQI